MIARYIAQILLTLAAAQIVPADTIVFIETGSVSSASEQVAQALEIFKASVSRLPKAQEIQPPRKVDPESLGVVVAASSALVVDNRSNAELFEKRSFEVRPIGSITKLMTTLVFLETNPALDFMAAPQESDIREGGKQNLYLNNPVKLETVLQTSLIGSDNTAAMILVRASGKSEQSFVARMNELAQELGMSNTRFEDPTGLSAGNVSTAQDIVLLLRKALANPIISQTTRTRDLLLTGPAGNQYKVRNTNELLDSFINEPPNRILGGKTGYISEAGYCLAAEVQNATGDSVFVVVLGSTTNFDRFQDVKSLAAWSFLVFEWPQKSDS